MRSSRRRRILPPPPWKALTHPRELRPPRNEIRSPGTGDQPPAGLPSTLLRSGHGFADRVWFPATPPRPRNSQQMTLSDEARSPPLPSRTGACGITVSTRRSARSTHASSERILPAPHPHGKGDLIPVERRITQPKETGAIVFLFGPVCGADHQTRNTSPPRQGLSDEMLEGAVFGLGIRPSREAARFPLLKGHDP